MVIHLVEKILLQYVDNIMDTWEEMTSMYVSNSSSNL